MQSGEGGLDDGNVNMMVRAWPRVRPERHLGQGCGQRCGDLRPGLGESRFPSSPGQLRVRSTQVDRRSTPLCACRWSCGAPTSSPASSTSTARATSCSQTCRRCPICTRQVRPPPTLCSTLALACSAGAFPHSSAWHLPPCRPAHGGRWAVRHSHAPLKAEKRNHHHQLRCTWWSVPQAWRWVSRWRTWWTSTLAPSCRCWGGARCPTSLCPTHWARRPRARTATSSGAAA